MNPVPFFLNKAKLHVLQMRAVCLLVLPHERRAQGHSNLFLRPLSLSVISEVAMRKAAVHEHQFRYLPSI